MKFELHSIEGGTSTTEDGGTFIAQSIYAPGIVKMAKEEYASRSTKRKEWALELIGSGWPSLPYLAVIKLVKGEYTVEGSTVIVDVPEIPNERDEISQKYNDSACNSCPNCGNDYLLSDHMETDGTSGWREVECNNCGTTFREVYQFSHIEEYTASEVAK